MKQIIKKRKDGSIWRKYYLNHLNKFNGLHIGYWDNGNIRYKTNYINDKEIGLETDYYNNKPIEITYHL